MEKHRVISSWFSNIQCHLKDKNFQRLLKLAGCMIHNDESNIFEQMSIAVHSLHYLVSK